MDVRGITGAWCIACLVASCAGDDPRYDDSIVLSAEITEGSSLRITVDSTFEPYLDQCHSWLELSKWSGTQWVPVQDDLSPVDSEHGYFMDGEFVEPRGGCSGTKGCIEHPAYNSPRRQDAVMTNLQAREYVKVGTKPAPNAAPGAPDVNVLESKPLTGRIEVTEFYYRDETCSGPRDSVTTEALHVP
jgi:hypothetical protein